MSTTTAAAAAAALALAIALGPLTGHTASRVVHTEEDLDFARCVWMMEQSVARLNVPANRIIPVVNTAISRITKIVLDDANLILMCSGPDRRLVIIESTPPDLHLIR